MILAQECFTSHASPFWVFAVLWKSELCPSLVLAGALKQHVTAKNITDWMGFFLPAPWCWMPREDERHTWISATWDRHVMNGRYFFIVQHTSSRPCRGAGSGDPQAKLGDLMAKAGVLASRTWTAWALAGWPGFPRTPSEWPHRQTWTGSGGGGGEYRWHTHIRELKTVSCVRLLEFSCFYFLLTSNPSKCSTAQTAL